MEFEQWLFKVVYCLSMVIKLLLGCYRILQNAVWQGVTAKSYSWALFLSRMNTSDCAQSNTAMEIEKWKLA